MANSLMVARLKRFPRTLRNVWHASGECRGPGTPLRRSVRAATRPIWRRVEPRGTGTSHRRRIPGSSRDGSEPVPVVQWPAKGMLGGRRDASAPPSLRGPASVRPFVRSSVGVLPHRSPTCGRRRTRAAVSRAVRGETRGVRGRDPAWRWERSGSSRHRRESVSVLKRTVRLVAGGSLVDVPAGRSPCPNVSARLRGCGAIVDASESRGHHTFVTRLSHGRCARTRSRRADVDPRRASIMRSGRSHTAVGSPAGLEDQRTCPGSASSPGPSRATPLQKQKRPPPGVGSRPFSRCPH